eukprot:TRINITY_DN18144_c0_g1_i2.p1 TRINITY_DN18144_c0_g1~~TRINITY_DN18144_c0_g1_i2.p1  ORF type:complete len:109 (-),score=44.90 TRINITY_DN18144_c0_g1_i2:138-464(-)
MFKKMDHPCVLHMLFSTTIESTMYVVVEQVQPLRALLDGLKFNKLCVSWGLKQLLTALEYIHHQGLTHGTVSSATVAVTATGDWNCLLYTSDAADDLRCVDLGGRRIL